MIDLKVAEPQDVKELVSIASGSVIGTPPTSGFAVAAAQTAIGTILAAANAKQAVGVFESGAGDSESVYLLLNEFRDLGLTAAFPTQVQTALGIVLSTAAKSELAGVFGSYGWSGEAIDEIESKLQDAGYSFGFDTIQVKFKPTDVTLQQCKEAGPDFAFALKKAKKMRVPRQPVSYSQIDRTEQAVGRLVGSLYVVAAKRENITSAMLTSWVSQASFNPPGLTIAVAKD